MPFLPRISLGAFWCALVPLVSSCDTGGADGKGQGDGLEQEEEVVEETSSCSASFTLGFPDGTTTTLDYCERFSLEATYEFDPDVPPEVRAPIVLFSAVEDDQFECRIGIRVPDACGTGYYLLDGESAGVDVITYDCTGVDDEYEGSFSSSGYLRVDTIDAGDVAGNLTGEPLTTTLAGYLSVTTETGITVTGDFSIAQDITGDDAEDSACASSDGDEDDDGFIDYRLDGDDCDDTFPLTYPGAAAMEPELCTRDADEDGYGEMIAYPPVDAGSDCNDGSSREYPGAVEEASATECMRDGDGDGYGDADVRGTSYDAGTDCDDADASANWDDIDGDRFSTCEGDCDDDRADINPDEAEVCDNDRDDNCDDRTDEYCAYDEASGRMTVYQIESSSYVLCTYELVSANSSSSGDCVDCDFHFYETETRLVSGDSRSCRVSFTTYVGINEVDQTIYIDSVFLGYAVEFEADINYWRESTQTVSLDWDYDWYRSESASYYFPVSGSLTLEGDW